MTHRLLGTDRPLAEVYDVALLDLDGVVHVGDRPVPGAPADLAEVRALGMRLAFVTNNASRTPDAVAARLSGMGVPAQAAEVTTSAQAAAHHLADVLPGGAAVLVVGGEGLHQAVAERGLRPTTTATDAEGVPVAAVVQGFAPEVGWTLLSEAAVAVRSGARWVATNLDRTIPSERGALPGNGSLVNVLQFAFGFEPESTGKPDPTMHRESVERSGAQRPVVVGDRLDTDIEGAVRASAPSLLVLSGVTDAAAALTAGPGSRPDHLARDVSGLLHAHPEVDWSSHPERSRTLGRWSAVIAGGVVRVGTVGDGGTGDGVTGPATDDGGEADDELDLLRLVAPAVWRLLDEAPADGSGAVPLVATDEAAAEVVRRWRVTGR